MRSLASWSYESDSAFGLRPTYWAISRRLEVSPKAVKQRLSHLRRSGVLRGLRAVPEPRLFGLERTGVLAVMNGASVARLKTSLPLIDFVESVYLVRQFQTLGDSSRYDKPADAYFAQLNLLHADGGEFERRAELLHAILGDFTRISTVRFLHSDLEPNLTRRKSAVLREFMRDPLAEIGSIAERAGVAAKSASKYLKALASRGAFTFDPIFDYTKLESLVFAIGVVLEPDQRRDVLVFLKKALRENWLAENSGSLNLLGITFMTDTMAELDGLWAAVTRGGELRNAVLTFSPEYLDNQANVPYMRRVPS